MKDGSDLDKSEENLTSAWRFVQNHSRFPISIKTNVCLKLHMGELDGSRRIWEAL